MKVAWEQYWSSGQNGCFSEGTIFANHVKALWLKHLGDLPFHKGDRILEVGAGGGFLTNLLLEYVETQDSQIALVATDYTESFVLQHNGNKIRSNLEFYSKVDIAALPFPEQSFDGYISNYAFEYAPIEAAVAELARVLKLGGYFLLNCHSDSSQITVENRLIMNAVNVWLDNRELDQMFSHLMMFTRSNIAPEQYFNYAKVYIQRLAALNESLNDGINKSGLIEPLIQLSRLTDMTRLTVYQKLRADFSAYVDRLQHQLNSALSSTKIETMIDCSNRVAFKDFSVREYNQDGFSSLIISGIR